MKTLYSEFLMNLTVASLTSPCHYLCIMYIEHLKIQTATLYDISSFFHFWTGTACLLTVYKLFTGVCGIMFCALYFKTEFVM